MEKGWGKIRKQAGKLSPREIAQKTALEELLRRMAEDKRMVPDPRKRLRLLKEQAKQKLRERAA